MAVCRKGTASDDSKGRDNRDRESVLESKRKRGVPREKAAGLYDSQIRRAGRLYAAWTGTKCWIEYERLADAVGLWREGNDKLSRDRAREIALRLGTELTKSELNRLYDTACEFTGEDWKYEGTDAITQENLVTNEQPTDTISLTALNACVLG